MIEGHSFPWKYTYNLNDKKSLQNNVNPEFKKKSCQIMGIFFKMLDTVGQELKSGVRLRIVDGKICKRISSIKEFWKR